MGEEGEEGGVGIGFAGFEEGDECCEGCGGAEVAGVGEVVYLDCVRWRNEDAGFWTGLPRLDRMYRGTSRIGADNGEGLVAGC